MKLFKSSLSVILVAIANAFLMMGIVWIFVDKPSTISDEALLVKWSSLFKKLVLKVDPKPTSGEILLIDISQNRIARPVTDEFGATNGYDVNYIVDRNLLTGFLKILNQQDSKAKFVFFDILFEDSTRFDAAFQEQINLSPSTILSIAKWESSDNGKNTFTGPCLKMNYGVAAYTSSNGAFLKYPLIIGDSMKTAPLRMYELLNHAVVEKKGPFLFINNKISFKTPVIDFKLRNSDLHSAEYPVYSMGQFMEQYKLIENDKPALRTWLKNKIVLVADFKSDIHETAFKKTAGVLLIFNTYLTLTESQNIVSPYWLGFVFVCFFLLSYKIFAELSLPLPSWIEKKSIVVHFIGKYLSNLGYLFAITILSYFLFNQHITILILTLYLQMVEFLIRKFKEYKEKRNSEKDSLPANQPGLNYSNVRFAWALPLLLWASLAKGQDLYVLNLKGNIYYHNHQLSQKQKINAFDTLVFKSEDAAVLLFCPSTNKRFRIPDSDREGKKNELLQELIAKYYKEPKIYFTGTKGTDEDAIEHFQYFFKWYFLNDSISSITFSNLDSSFSIPAPAEFSVNHIRPYLKTKTDVIPLVVVDNYLLITKAQVWQDGSIEPFELWIADDQQKKKYFISLVAFQFISLPKPNGK